MRKRLNITAERQRQDGAKCRELNIPIHWTRPAAWQQGWREKDTEIRKQKAERRARLDDEMQRKMRAGR